MDLSDLRKEYKLDKLERENLSPTPEEQFHKWWEQAIKAKLTEPNAFCLATANKQGTPSCRMVLLKSFDASGFVFFTNLASHKSVEIEGNPSVAATFWWSELERQVRLQGHAEQVSEEIAAAYFAKRPRTSQLSAWASQQDAVIPNRAFLEENAVRIDSLYAGQDLPLPPYWGGFRIIPTTYEFWQGRPDRLHDRFLYRKNGSAWITERLSP